MSFIIWSDSSHRKIHQSWWQCDVPTWSKTAIVTAYCYRRQLFTLEIHFNVPCSMQGLTAVGPKCYWSFVVRIAFTKPSQNQSCCLSMCAIAFHTCVALGSSLAELPSHQKPFFKSFRLVCLAAEFILDGFTCKKPKSDPNSALGWHLTVPSVLSGRIFPLSPCEITASLKVAHSIAATFFACWTCFQKVKYHYDEIAFYWGPGFW